MNNSRNIYLSTAYLPPVEYFALMIANGNPLIEKWENYSKQSYRNRCHIYSANGLLALNIPVERAFSSKIQITDTRIDYSYDWQIRHWRAIVSAYKSSPFFEYFEDDFRPFFFKKEVFLYDLNFKMNNLIIELLGINVKVGETESFEKNYSNGDYRYIIHPKESNLDIIKNGQYQQVFAHKYGFIPNLSIIDLLFNEGPSSVDFCSLKLESDR
jgi:hypothetical protein